jgi:hypothetical protein
LVVFSSELLKLRSIEFFYMLCRILSWANIVLNKCAAREWELASMRASRAKQFVLAEVPLDLFEPQTS